MGGIEVFDRLDGESVRCRRVADRAQLFVGPELIGVAGESPAALAVTKVGAAGTAIRVPLTVVDGSDSTAGLTAVTW